MQNYLSPNDERFIGESDSKSIQNAIDEAEKGPVQTYNEISGYAAQDRGSRHDDIAQHEHQGTVPPVHRHRSRNA